MPEFIQNGLEWMAGVLKASTSREFVFCRDMAGVCRLQAVVGDKPMQRSDEFGGTYISWEFTDLQVLADDLRLGGVRVLPEPGDRFEARRPGGRTLVYEATPPNEGEECWRWCDTDEKHMRIHVKQVARRGVRQ